MTVISWICIQLAGTRVTEYTDTTSVPYPTIRHLLCEFLVSTASQCLQCSKYRNTLCKMVSCANQRKPDAFVCPSSHANYCYLQHNEKDEQLRNMHSLYQNKKSKLNRLRVKIVQASSISGIQLDTEMHTDMASMIYHVQNPHASEERYLYFISDPPHLMHEDSEKLLG